MAAPIPVRPGQIWADKNQWNAGRTVRVLAVDNARATVAVETEAGGYPIGPTVGRSHRVLHDHRGLRGYRLVSEPDDTAGSAS